VLSNPHLPLSGHKTTSDGTHSGRLPGTVRTEEPHNFSLSNGETDIIHLQAFTIVFSQVLYFDHNVFTVTPLAFFATATESILHIIFEFSSISYNSSLLTPFDPSSYIRMLRQEGGSVKLYFLLFHRISINVVIYMNYGKECKHNGVLIQHYQLAFLFKEHLLPMKLHTILCNRYSAF